MKYIRILKANSLADKALDLIVKPVKELGKAIDFTEGEWFNEGEIAILSLPKEDFDTRENMSTDKIDEGKQKIIDSIDGQEVEITHIDKTVQGEPSGIGAVTSKPTYVTIKFKDGNEWKEIPTTWLAKKDEKKEEEK